MPLDVTLFRKEGGQIDQLKESQRKRFQPEAVIDEITAIDADYRAALFALEQKNGEVRKKSKEVGAAMKKKEDASKIIAEVKEVKEEIEKLEKKTAELLAARDAKINTIGNLVHSSVTVSKDEKDNKVDRSFGECKKPVNGKERHHHELLHMIDGYDTDRATPMAGHRAFFLKGPGVLLNQALINYGLAFLMAKNHDEKAENKKNWLPLQPPFFMNKSVMGETAQLSDFAETLYKVVGEEGEEEKFLIATSEQPISAYHRQEHIEPEALPLRYCGLSTCFRKEAGAYGRDAWGIFRIHQFEKVEQFCITTPDKSWEMHEEMIKNCEEFYQSLGIPYRVVNIISGELNNAASKKYDLEAWFPTLGVFRELVSASNCTDYQSRAMQTRLGGKKVEGKQPFVHMLNATLTATERTICCILENYQTETGVKVPEKLQPFMGGIKFFPFVKDAPVNKTQVKQAQAKAAAGDAKDSKDAKDKPATASTATAAAGGESAAGAGAAPKAAKKGGDKKEGGDKKADKKEKADKKADKKEKEKADKKGKGKGDAKKADG